MRHVSLGAAAQYVEDVYTHTHTHMRAHTHAHTFLIPLPSESAPMSDTVNPLFFTHYLPSPPPPSRSFILLFTLLT